MGAAPTPEELAEDAAHELVGTCKSEHELDERFDGMFDDERFCAALDERIFRCEGCEWWCDRSEESESSEGFCDQCDP